jgi:hypothetical protein
MNSFVKISKEKRKKYTLSPSFCLNDNCKIELSFEKRIAKFCSHSCSASFYNLSKVKIKNKCLRCSKNVKDSTKLCRECENKSLLERWNVGENICTPSGGIVKCVYAFLRKEHNSCTSCGWNKINPATGRCPLEIDHIDGDRSNNSKSNLRVLCPNCHSLTPTFRSLNNKPF